MRVCRPCAKRHVRSPPSVSCPAPSLWHVWFLASSFCYFSPKGRLDSPCVMYSNQKRKDTTGLVCEKRVLKHAPLQGYH